MNEWKALDNRISIFPTQSESSSPSALEIYTKIWGDPDSFQKPQGNALAPSVAQGKRNNVVINCTSQPTRIDFNILPIPSMQPSILEFIDDVQQLKDELNHIIDNIEKGIFSDPVLRVALNLHFVKLSSGYIETNKILSEVIPDRYGLKLKDEEEFVFQINQPCTSKSLSDIKMNFLTKWSADRLQFFAIPLQGAAQLNPTEKIVASVLLDGNNIPTRPLTNKEQSTLLHEALDSAGEIQQEIGLNIEEF